MHKLFLWLAVTAAIILPLSAQNNYKERILIFEDDFNGPSEIPDTTKWSLIPRGYGNWDRHMSESYAQAYQKDGSLFLIGELSDGQYLTGGIETRGKFDFEYGIVECRARLARNPQGGHNAIWMMPSPPAERWPKGGEIDIMEHINKEDKVYGTIHSWYADRMYHYKDPQSHVEVPIDKDAWNVYGLRWTPEHLTFTVNGNPYFTYPNLHLEGEDGFYQWPFNHRFFLILDQSLGGEHTWAGEIDDSELPAILEIDWIRVYQTPDEIASSGAESYE